MFLPEGFGVARLVFSGPGKSLEKVTTFGYDIGTSLNPSASASNIDAAARAAGSIANTADIAVGYSYVGVSVTEERGLGPIGGFAGVSVNGTGSANPTTPNVAMLVTKRTARGGRQGRGRMYFPPIFFGEADINPAGQMGQVFVDVISGHLETFRTELIDAENDMVLLHSDPSLPPDPVLSLTLQPLVATQRRRLR